MIYNSLAANLYNQCSTRFEAKDFEGALNSFETLIKITESDLYAGSKDTAIYYNAGLAAVNCNKYNEAIKYFEKCSEMKYMGITPYYLIYQSYLGLGDSIKAESILTGLPKLFPNDKSITLQLIDFYSMSSKFDEAQEYITVAKESDPNNYSLYFAAGIMYLNQNKYDQAISELGKSIELNHELYDTQYSLGAAYINKAVEMFTKANEIMDVKKHTEVIDSANIVYAKALPYLEKAYELNPNDVETMSCLRELYYRLKMTKEYDEIKAKLDAINAQQK
ncbi:MAG: hypothetical protein NTZ85_07310 [Bacteroidia bacterium]|nr:hypothetical protein [Bacteroidia bacterium]